MATNIQPFQTTKKNKLRSSLNISKIFLVEIHTSIYTEINNCILPLSVWKTAVMQGWVNLCDNRGQSSADHPLEVAWRRGSCGLV